MAVPVTSRRTATSTPRVRRARPESCANTMGSVALLRVGCGVLAEVTRRGAGLGDDVAAGAGGAGLEAGVLPQRLDELVDPLVAGVVDLELEAPRLHGDRLVPARGRAPEHVFVAAALLGRLLRRVCREGRDVREPHGTTPPAV